MKPSEIAELAGRMRAAGAYGLEVEQGEFSLCLRLDRAILEKAIPASAGKTPADTVRAAAPGLFRAGGGACDGMVSSGDIVAFIDAGPLALPVVASRVGRLGSPLVHEGEAVEFGQALFEYEEI